MTVSCWNMVYDGCQVPALRQRLGNANMFRQVLRNMPAWGISYSPWVTAPCDLPNVVLIPLTSQHIYYFTDRGVWLVGFSALRCVPFPSSYWDIYSTTVKSPWSLQRAFLPACIISGCLQFASRHRLLLLCLEMLTATLTLVIFSAQGAYMTWLC